MLIGLSILVKEVLMGDPDRFEMMFERHIGIGIRWESKLWFQLHLSIALPFVTFTIGIGPRHNPNG